MRVRNLIVLLSLLWALPVEAQLVRFPSIEIGTVSVGCRYQSLNVGDDNPNGDVTGSICDVVIETTTGAVWTKTSGTATTSGWVALTSSATTGTVTSVALTAPGIFSVSGSPITASGTLALSLANQSANTVFAGPASGSASTPGFRQIVFGDIDDNGCASGQIPKWDGDSWECSDDAGASSGAPTASQYVTLATDATLTNERVLTQGGGVTLTDAGAGSTLTLGLGTALDFTSKTVEVPHSNTLPATCAVGEIYKDDNATSGQQMYACEATDTWALQGDGGGGGASPGGSSGDLQINDGAGGFDPYAGDGCSPGDFVTDIAADGTVTCDTPAGGSGGLVLLESHTASSSAALEFNTRNAAGQSGATFQSDFDEYVIKIVGLVVATDNVDLGMQYSPDGGSSYNSTSNYYTAGNGVLNGGAGTTFGAGTNPTSAFVFALGIDNASSRPLNATLYAALPLSTTLDKNVYGQITNTNQSNVIQMTVNGLMTVPGTAFNAFKIYASSGNLASGTIRVYGVQK